MKKITAFLAAIALAAVLGIFAYAATDASITIENDVATVTNAPENSTLITAFYNNNELSDVRLFKGSGTITADIAEEMSDADKVKMFLWDMETLEPLSENMEVSVNMDNPGNFNFETKTVTLNSGYEMPINGLGTYSLHGETCINSVKSALANGVRLIDTASAYGNEVEVGQAIRESMEELGIKREDIFVITKIYPGEEMAKSGRVAAGVHRPAKYRLCGYGAPASPRPERRRGVQGYRAVCGRR